MSDQYQQYSTVKKYWQLMRPHTLTAAVVPVLVGTAAAKIYLLGSEDHLKFSLFLAMLLACLLIQAATNMFNEYYDFKKGLDDHTSVGIGGAIVRNGMSPKQVMNLAIAFLHHCSTFRYLFSNTKLILDHSSRHSLYGNWLSIYRWPYSNFMDTFW